MSAKKPQTFLNGSKGLKTDWRVFVGPYLLWRFTETDDRKTVAGHKAKTG
jgi:hypothetical protein